MVTRLRRIFLKDGGRAKDTQLPDPNPDFTPEEVLKHYISLYPELSNSSISGPEIKNETLVFSFKTSVGSKG